tara:strand:- start:487 stop:657 length:171 start_codon:yes stop_codon:yes gene_type:complete
MPKLMSTVNQHGAIGIRSDGTKIGDATSINIQNRNITAVSSGIATLTTDPLTVVGL